MARKKKGSVGVIGLGIMGGAFARHLAAAGWTVVGYDPSKKAAAAARRAGVFVVDSACRVANMMPVIITSLPDPQALIDTARDIAGHKNTLTERIFVEMSTFSVKDKEKSDKILRKAGHIMLDCPVSGTGAQAKVKDIVIYASGDSRAIRRVKPLFADFSRGMHDLGAFGNASRMKYVANLLVAIHNVATAEAMVLGMKAGLDPKAIFETVKTGAGNSRVFELRGPMMVADDYGEATMKIKVWQKDMQVIGDFAKGLGVPTPLFAATRAIYDKALKSGYAMQDTAAVCAVMEKMAGVKRKAKTTRS